MFGVTPMLATVLSWGLPAVALGLLVAAGAAFLYLPVVGRGLSALLIAASAGVFAYDAGFRERASIDHSAQLAAEVSGLKAQATETQRQIEAANAVAKADQDRQAQADDAASAMQERIHDYEAQLATRPAGDCRFTDADVGGLLSIGSRAKPGNPPQPPSRPADIR